MSYIPNYKIEKNSFSHPIVWEQIPINKNETTIPKQANDIYDLIIQFKGNLND